MATIRIHDLQIETIIGVYESERRKKQKLIVNLEFCYNSHKAIETDRITRAVDYEELTHKIINHAAKAKFFLMESLASSILDVVMEDKKIRSAGIRIDKPHAVDKAESVSVELHFTRRG